MRIITTGPYRVLDYPPVEPGWDFWTLWATGGWEKDTHRLIGEWSTGRRYVDIGAWVGPTVLWAAQAGATHIRCYEPDPVAHGVLKVNVAINDLDVEVHGEAVTPHGGPATLETSEFGESMTGSGGDLRYTADGVSVADACDGAEFVKVDVEGAEIDLLPELAKVGCPMLVSLHAPWWPPGAEPDFTGWGKVETVEDGGGFGEVLCLP